MITPKIADPGAEVTTTVTHPSGVTVTTKPGPSSFHSIIGDHGLIGGVSEYPPVGREVHEVFYASDQPPTPLGVESISIGNYHSLDAAITAICSVDALVRKAGGAAS